MPKSSSSKKRSAFDLVSNLELEDQAAAKLRKKASTREVSQAKAARSQTKIYGHLMETRILLQRSLQQEQNEQEIDQCDKLLEQLLTARRNLMPSLEEETKEEEEDDIDTTLQSEYEICQQNWKTVLNKRHQDLRLHAGLAAKNQFQVLDSSFWQQVEATVAHQEMRRSSAGNSEEEFEDAKVYQQMLKDFLVTSSNSGSAAAAESTALSRPHSQKKKQVDRKASKGRKIRYVEIPKLVNFTFPISKASNSSLNADEWFQSLFGGGRQQQQQSSYETALTTTFGSATISDAD